MTGKIVNKTWGYELWFANVQEGDVRYCGKQIFVNYGDWSSKGAYHYHRKKDETFFVVDGYLQLDYIVGSHLDQFKTVILGPSESFRIKPWMAHRFTSAAKNGCKFIEASTFHDDNDSCRCKWDEEKEEWVAVPAA